GAGDDSRWRLLGGDVNALGMASSDAAINLRPRFDLAGFASRNLFVELDDVPLGISHIRCLRALEENQRRAMERRPGGPQALAMGVYIRHFDAEMTDAVIRNRAARGGALWRRTGEREQF